MPKNKLSESEISDLQNLFSYHAPDADQAERYAAINQAAFEYAKTVLECTPKSADQSAAVRQIRESRMTANAAIACGE